MIKNRQSQNQVQIKKNKRKKIPSQTRKPGH